MIIRKLVPLFFLIFCSFAASSEPDNQATLDKAFISFRIATTLYLPEARFQELQDLFLKYKGVTDEVTFFTSATHPPLPASVIKQRAQILSGRMAAMRSQGLRSGINILSTMGHHEENLQNSLTGEYTYVTDINGQVCRGSFCPNDVKLQAYIREVYQYLALADPDYIWLDDDIRLAGHMPISLTCFCDHCLSIFEKETGYKHTRSSLKKALNDGTIADKLLLRKAWLQHNRNTIANLFTLIEKTVHEIRPHMPLGFMTGERFFEGYDFDRWADVLHGPNHTPVYWRPGGGYYQDMNTTELVGKSHEIGRQVSLLPEYVVSIQSEIENFPYQRLKKAANMVVLEACSHMAAGCTGVAFNVLSMYDEPLNEFEPLVAELAKARPFFDLLARHLGRQPLAGVQTFWDKNTFATANLMTGSWFESASLLPGNELFDIGLPAAYGRANANLALLSKAGVYALTREEIIKLLSGGVYMDAETCQYLNAMGLGDLVGFDVLQTEKMDRIEKFTEHPLNAGFVGRLRDNRQSFLGWNVPAATLKIINPKAQTLCSLIDYADKEVAKCAMGIFENRLGGRICVAGYYPWTYVQNLAKSSQLKSVFRWLARDSLPAFVASYHKINLWIRKPQNGKIALAMTNSSFDGAEHVDLMLLTEKKIINVFDMNGKQTVLYSQGKDGPLQKFTIPFIDPWQMRLVVTE